MDTTARTRHSTHTARRLLGPALLAGVLLLASCGGGSDDKAGGASSGSAPSTTAKADDGGSKAVASDGAVTIKGFAFDPPDIKVKAGTEVTWTNQDSATHTSTGDDGDWNTKSIKPGSGASHTFDAAGTFTYHCDIHPTMTGTVVVEG